MQEVSKKMQAQFDKMRKGGKLFRSKVTGQQVWEMYLSSFKPQDDPVFRDPESTVHNCNHCKNFIRRYGNIVSIDPETFEVVSMFDFYIEGEYARSVANMSSLLTTAPIVDIFIETFDELNSLPYESCTKSNKVFRLGFEKNHKRYTREESERYGVVKPNEIRTFHHFHLDIPEEFVDKSGRSSQAIMGDYRSAKDVFLRGMEEIPLDTLQLVSELISQGSLLNGEAHAHKVSKIIPFKKKFDKLNKPVKDNWAWLVSHGFQFAKFKNELIGVLCSDLAEGVELNKACLDWNKRVDPANYMRATAPITEAQKKNATKFAVEHGYGESFYRRMATLDDIKAEEIKHINVGDGSIEELSIFDSVKVKSTRHKKSEFKGIEEVGIEKFMEQILPNCTGVEAYLENSHEGNLVSLTTAVNQDSKGIFKWKNPFSWTYKGNLAGKSMIKEAVKSQGGKVDGVLRFSIMWSEGGSVDNSDLDAHCKEPDGNEIYFSRKISWKTGGNLDIDITQPLSHKSIKGKEVVENITYPRLSQMEDGSYKFMVNQYSGRGSEGFKAEIEFNGELYHYEYNEPVRGKIAVATVTLKDGNFEIIHLIPSTSSNKEIYGIKTNNFHKVNLVCLSPNHWGKNNTGNKHYFFMLDKCLSDKPLKGFHSENLNGELRDHRKFLDVLSAVNMVDSTKPQLSGIGFNSTVRDEIILRLKGSFKRVIKVKF